MNRLQIGALAKTREPIAERYSPPRLTLRKKKWEERGECWLGLVSPRFRRWEPPDSPIQPPFSRRAGVNLFATTVLVNRVSRVRIRRRAEPIPPCRTSRRADRSGGTSNGFSRLRAPTRVRQIRASRVRPCAAHLNRAFESPMTTRPSTLSHRRCDLTRRGIPLIGAGSDSAAESLDCDRRNAVPPKRGAAAR